MNDNISSKKQLQTAVIEEAGVVFNWLLDRVKKISEHSHRSEEPAAISREANKEAQRPDELMKALSMSGAHTIVDERSVHGGMEAHHSGVHQEFFSLTSETSAEFCLADYSTTTNLPLCLSGDRKQRDRTTIGKEDDLETHKGLKSLNEIFEEMIFLSCSPLRPISFEPHLVERSTKSWNKYVKRKREANERRKRECLHQANLSSKERCNNRKVATAIRRLRKIEKSLNKWRSRKRRLNDKLKAMA